MNSSTGLTRRFLPYFLRLGGLLLLTIVLLGLQSANAGYAASPLEQQGATIVVNTLQDAKQAGDGACSLREAVIAANTNKQSGGKSGECIAGGSGTDIIQLAAGTYNLGRSDNGNEDASSTGDIDVSSSVEIRGLGFGQTIINSGPDTISGSSGIADRAIHVVSGGNLTLVGVTVTKNGGTVAGDGGGIYNGATLTLRDSTVSDNRATGSGGGIFNSGVLTVKNSLIGGVLSNAPDAGPGKIGNTAGDSGGAIANASSGSVTLDNSTVSGNTAGNTATNGDGGGIFNEGVLLLNNATIASNLAPNGMGGGVVNGDTGTVNVRNTIVASNGPTDCSGVIISQGHNLDSDGTCVTSGGPNGDQTNSSPGLDGLENNGGPTLTRALLVGSPAIDAGDDTGCFGSMGVFAFDQRGEVRPVDGDNNGTVRCDIGAFEFGHGENALVLLRAFPNVVDGLPVTTAQGLLEGALDTTINVNFFSTCAAAMGDFLHSATEVPTDENGYFEVNISEAPGQFQFLTAKANDPNNGALRQSNCVPVSFPNDAWAPNPYELFPDPIDFVDTHFIDGPGQSRWYKFKVKPNQDLSIILSGVNPDPNNPNDTDFPLPADYELTLYKDLQIAFDEAISDPDLELLSAQFAGSSYSGSSYSGSSYSGSSYSGSSYSGSSYSGSSYSGSSYSGSSYSGSSYSGSSYSGSSYSGSSYSGSSYSGSSYSGSSYSGSSYSGSSYSDAVFGGSSYSEAQSDAQARSLLAVSAYGGTIPETIFVHTWNSDEEYYVRVRSSNGEFSLDAPFRLQVELTEGGCDGVDASGLPGTSHSASAGNYETLILVNQARMADSDLFSEGAPGALAQLQANLNALESDQGGHIVDLSTDNRVNAANALADANPQCPFAKNLAAEAVKTIVDDYRAQNPSLEYMVIVGGDAIIPFFRHPDFADLAKESQYVPPVLDSSASQASLKLDYVLSDNNYAAKAIVPIGNSDFPIVDNGLASGRLVETAADMNAVIEAFFSAGGVVSPQSSLVTGYDFLEDAAIAIRNELAAGTGNTPNELITSFDVPPTDPSAWTADQLRDALLGSRHDMVFLSGHFNGHSALAADYATEMLAAEITDPNLSDDLFTNTVFFGPGCHMAYNTINQDGIPGATIQPDWTSAIIGQGGTVVGSTGYGYGETLTKEYSERLFIEFSQRIRLDTGGPISIGHALNAAKSAYITQVPSIRGIHEKVLLSTTVFGLPMLGINMPGRQNLPEDQSVINNLDSFNTNPGLTTGLQFADLSVTSPLNVNDVPLRDVDTNETVNGQFLSGDDDGGNEDVVTFPTEPFLPLEVRNVTAEGTVLRGVGFRGGSYQDIPNTLPVTGAPTTEAIALHLSWITNYFHPIQMWNSNYLGALVDGQQRILFTPAQHMADPNNQSPIRKSIRREFSETNFRLYYNGDLTDFSGHIPALSAPPSIVRISAIPGTEEIFFRMTVVGDPAAGIQEVWVVWTDGSNPDGNGVWQPLDLTQRETDTRIWERSLALNGVNPADIRYMVGAVNGFGLVSMAMGDGNYYTPGVDADPTVDTLVELTAPSSGVFGGDPVDFSATLTADEQPLAGQVVEFRLGPGLAAQGVTNSSGIATVSLNLLSSPGDYKLYAAFDGNSPYKASSDVADFTIEQQQTSLSEPAAATVFPGEDSGIQITLVDQFGEPLRERGVFIVVSPPGDPNTVLYTVAGITDLFGNVSLGVVPLPSGFYDVTVYFNHNSNPLTSLSSDTYNSDKAETTLTILPPPCDPTETPDPDTFLIYDDDAPSIWPPNGDMVDVDIMLNDGDLLAITIDSIKQDEPIGTQGPDGVIVSEGTPTARIQLRAERDGEGDGRVYVVTFTGTSPDGFSCTRTVKIPVVSHDEATDPDAADSGPPYYDSTETPKFAPEAVDDPFNTNEDDPVSDNVLANDIPGKPGDILTVSAVNGDANAVGVEITLASDALLTLNADGGFTYNPAGQFNSLPVGGAAVDTFVYELIDDEGTTATATVTINLAGTNDAPTANDDSATVEQGGTVTVLDDGVTDNLLANDSDPDAGDTLTVNTTPVVPPSSGNLTLNETGTFSYTHNNSETASDSFTYEIADGNGGTSTATVQIAVIVNNPPDAVDDAATVDEGGTITQLNGGATSVLANDSDPDGDALTVNTTPVSGPSNGSLALNADGTFSYTHNGGETTSDSFVYQINDGNGETDTATVNITINPVNDAPVANDDPVNHDTNVSPSLNINVIANDTDADGTLDPTTVATTDPSNGQVSVNPDTAVVTYTPIPGFNGQDSFTYTVDDDGGLTSNVATVTVNVTSNRPPVAQDDNITTTKGISVTIDVRLDHGNGRDTDPDDDPLTVISFTQGNRGVVTSNGDGTLTYTPSSNFKGDDSFEYTISDGKGETDTATVFITTN